MTLWDSSEVSNALRSPKPSCAGQTSSLKSDYLWLLDSQQTTSQPTRSTLVFFLDIYKSDAFMLLLVLELTGQKRALKG